MNKDLCMDDYMGHNADASAACWLRMLDPLPALQSQPTAQLRRHVCALHELDVQ